MNKRYENRFTSLYTIRRVFKRNESRIATTTGLRNAVSEFDGMVGQLEVQREIQERETKGVTLDKAEEQKKLAHLAFVVAMGVLAYATKNHLHSLAEEMRVTESQLINERDTRTYADSLRIYNSGIMLAAEVRDYDITDVMLADLNGSLRMYEYLMTAPRDAQGNRKNAGEEITRLLAAIELHLHDVIDGLMHVAGNTWPDFLKDYLSAREVIDYGVRHEKPEDPTDAGPDVTTDDGTKDGGGDPTTGK